MMQHVRRLIPMRPWLAKGSLVALALVSLVALSSVAISAYAHELTPHHEPLGPGWTIALGAQVKAPISYLSAAATLTSTDAWVGGQDFTDGAPATLFEHWNGKRWSSVSSPSPGNEFDYITAMSADHSNDVWAVGFYMSLNTNGNTSPLIEHWNGTRWSNVASPIPSHGVQTELNGVTALSATDVWVIGSYLVSGVGLPIPFVEHWNGMHWSFAALPGIGSSYYLYAITGISGSNVWVAGAQYPNDAAQPLIMHWNGLHWHIVPAANTGIGGRLFGITAIASTDIWAVGSEYPGSGFVSTTHPAQTLAEHWNGSTWRVIQTPTINSSEFTIFTGVAAKSSNVVWAIGYTTPSGESTGLPFINEWNGTRWTTVSIPVGPSMTIGSRLSGISATPQGGVWVAGFLTPLHEQNPKTLILRHL